MVKKSAFDLRLIIGLVIAHVLLYFSFQDRAIFWYIFSGSILVLIAFAIIQGDVDDEASFIQYIFLGVISGVALYFVFWLGHQLMEVLGLPLQKEINRLYKWFAPSLFWEYLALILVAAPGEELFWRGFVQKRLLRYMNPASSIVIASLLYASVQIYSGSYILLLVTFLSGLAWGSLYFWKKSMPLVIVSHIIFDIMIFVILPFK